MIEFGSAADFDDLEQIQKLNRTRKLKIIENPPERTIFALRRASATSRK